jgi:hypothetical protein
VTGVGEWLRRRRTRAWAGLYVGLFGDDDDREDADEVSGSEGK